MSTGKTRHGVKRENPGSTKPSPNKANVAPKTSTKNKGSARSKQINAKSNRHAPESKFLALSAVQSRERAKPDHLFETESADNTTSKRQKSSSSSSSSLPESSAFSDDNKKKAPDHARTDFPMSGLRNCIYRSCCHHCIDRSGGNTVGKEST